MNTFFKKLRIKVKNKKDFYLIKVIKALYRFNFFLVNTKNNQYSGYFDKKKCFTKMASVSNEFLMQAKKDLQIKKRDYYKGHKNYKYLYYDYPSEYLTQINLAWNIDRKKYFNFLDRNFGSLIKKIYNGNNYRVEQIFLYETINENSSETFNLNSTWHTDGDYSGAMKILVYLCNVNDANGPFCYKEFDSNNNEKIFIIKGETGTSVFFNQNECLHSAANTVENKRTAISFLIYPSLRKKIYLDSEKPLNTICALNPFTKYC